MTDRLTTAYFDVGTSNMRLYLLDTDFRVLHMVKKTFGARNVVLNGRSQQMLRQMKELFDDTLAALHCPEDRIRAIYASGMVTSRFGIVEVPHLTVPASEKDFHDAMVYFYDPNYFTQPLHLIPGLKAEGVSCFETNNIRGEEIEAFGALETLQETRQEQDFALFLPGSHTQILHIQDGRITDMLSTITGELFFALQQETILSDLLRTKLDRLDPEFLQLGRKYAQELGFNRAIYICNTMQVFSRYLPHQQFSYAEGVIHSGVIDALEHKCVHHWKDCHAAVLACNEFQHELYAALLENNPYIHNIIWLPLSGNDNFAVKGLRRIVQQGGNCK